MPQTRRNSQTQRRGGTPKYTMSQRASYARGFMERQANRAMASKHMTPKNVAIAASAIAAVVLLTQIMHLVMLRHKHRNIHKRQKVQRLNDRLTTLQKHIVQFNDKLTGEATKIVESDDFWECAVKKDEPMFQEFHDVAGEEAKLSKLLPFGKKVNIVEQHLDHLSEKLPKWEKKGQDSEAPPGVLQWQTLLDKREQAYMMLLPKTCTQDMESLDLPGSEDKSIDATIKIIKQNLHVLKNDNGPHPLLGRLHYQTSTSVLVKPASGTRSTRSKSSDIVSAVDIDTYTRIIRLKEDLYLKVGEGDKRSLVKSPFHIATNLDAFTHDTQSQDRFDFYEGQTTERIQNAKKAAESSLLPEQTILVIKEKAEDSFDCIIIKPNAEAAKAAKLESLFVDDNQAPIEIFADTFKLGRRWFLSSSLPSSISQAKLKQDTVFQPGNNPTGADIMQYADEVDDTDVDTLVDRVRTHIENSPKPSSLRSRKLKNLGFVTRRLKDIKIMKHHQLVFKPYLSVLGYGNRTLKEGDKLVYFDTKKLITHAPQKVQFSVSSEE